MLSRTPYMRGPQDAMDDARCRMVIVVGPERSGKSVGGENYAFKSMRNGPIVETIFYMPPGESLNRYADKEFGEFFSLHPTIQRKVGRTATENAKASKKISGKWTRLFAMSDRNLRQLEAPLIIATEIDALGKKLASKVIQEIRGRQKSFGNAAKAYIESHPDLGWDAGIAPGWKEGSRAVMYWTCPHCKKMSTPHQLAPSGMMATMVYHRDDTLTGAAQKWKAMQTARLECPHCAAHIDDEDRYKMIDGHVWVETGSVSEESVDDDGVVTDVKIYNPIQSFWLHGLQVKRPLGELAAEHLEATIHFERTRDLSKLKRYRVKSLGEVDEGPSKRSSSTLRQKAIESQETFSFERGTVPDGFKFVVAAVDQGGAKFDIAWYAFDLEGRSALLDRIKVTDRIMPDGSRRDIRPAENIDDWMQIQQVVIERMFPLASDPDKSLPVAVVAIDTGGSGKRDKNDLPDGATYKAREFARRMNRAGKHWGQGRYQVVKLFKGFASKDDKVILAVREINTDENNKPISPVVREFNINVSRTKAISQNRLAVTDGGPGQCYFANGLPDSVFDELCAEQWVDGQWVRRGANETWDLFGYAEALRVLLDPENERYQWHKSLPIWATPISKTVEKEAKPPPRPLSRWERRAQSMNQGI